MAVSKSAARLFFTLFYVGNVLAHGGVEESPMPAAAGHGAASPSVTAKQAAAAAPSPSAADAHTAPAGAAPAAPSSTGAAAAAAAHGAPATGAVTTTSHAKGPNPDEVNWELVRNVVWAWIAIMGAFMIYVLVSKISKYVRQVSCLHNDTQRYFNEPNTYWGLLQKHFIEAPLLRKRHHREFRLSRAMDIGTLPSRSQMFFLVGYVAVSIFITVYSIDFSQTKAKIYSALIMRSGLLAIVNMAPLFLLAGRNNPLITWTGITFDTYNLIHRWLGRITVLEVLLHGSFWMAKKFETMPADKAWAAIGAAVTSSKSDFIPSGFTGFVAGALILVQSQSTIRHAFYETFLHVHFILAGVFVGGAWIHLKDEEYHAQRALIKAVIAIWAIERGIRVFRLVYRNIGQGGTQVEVTAMPGDAIRIKMRVARPWKFAPGQHAYIYLPSAGWWTSHPFSVAWDDFDPVDEVGEKDSLPSSSSDIVQRRNQNIYFVIKRRTGFTERLWRKAIEAPNGVWSGRAYAEGPYNSQSLGSYGTVLLVAAGVGITHQVPHVRALVDGYANGTVATRKVTLVWIIPSPDLLEWIREWMTVILSMPRRREVLKIMLFVTRPKNAKEIYSPSSSVQMYPGKPNIQSLVDNEVATAVGAIGVSVCGVGAVADDVRSACRSWMGKVSIDFEEESFSW